MWKLKFRTAPLFLGSALSCNTPPNLEVGATRSQAEVAAPSGPQTDEDCFARLRGRERRRSTLGVVIPQAPIINVNLELSADAARDIAERVFVEAFGQQCTQQQRPFVVSSPAAACSQRFQSQIVKKWCQAVLAAHDDTSRAALDGWNVVGTLHGGPWVDGGTAHLIIRKADGAVLEIGHGK